MVKAEAVYESPVKTALTRFVVKILTSNPLALKILQTTFLQNPRQSRLSEGVGEGGTPLHAILPKTEPVLAEVFRSGPRFFFRQFPQRT